MLAAHSAKRALIYFLRTRKVALRAFWLFFFTGLPENLPWPTAAAPLIKSAVPGREQQCED